MFTLYNVSITLIFVSPLILFYAFIPLVKGLLKARKIGSRRKLALCIFSLCVLVPATLCDLFVWFVCVLVIPIYPHNRFDRNDWAADVSKRYTMADDIVDSHILIGLTKQQAIDLLGKPYREWDKLNNTIRFDIGDRPTPVGDADPDELVLDLKDGKVVKAYLHET